MRILLSGRIGSAPFQGGAAWAVLQYLLGLRRLGHQVWFAEPVAPGDSRVASYFRRVMGAFQLQGRAALFDPHSRRSEGLSWDELRGAAQCCDVLVNLSGLLRDEDLVGPIPVRLYLDLDPAFTQLWQHAQGIDMGFSIHTHFATVGLAIGREQCPVPVCGLDWIPTLQPIVLDLWPQSSQHPRYGWTTVANWRSYGSVEYQGCFYGQRAHSWREFMTLPRLMAACTPGQRLQPALAIHPDERQDLAQLAECGWELLDPGRVAGDPGSYRSFIQQSRLELGIAKSGYVHSRCGWFSDRSVCYLASGRPVVAQDTGFGALLPCGEGLFSFRTAEDVLTAAAAIQPDYRRHCNAARRIAAEFFDSDRVLTGLLRKVGCAS